MNTDVNRYISKIALRLSLRVGIEMGSCSFKALVVVAVALLAFSQIC